MKKAIMLGAVMAIAALGFAAAAIATGPPTDPPGNSGNNPGSPGDDCSRGASDQECKDDPQPDKGKDCEDHGNAAGNEDHCAPADTTTTTTEEEIDICLAGVIVKAPAGSVGDGSCGGIIETTETTDTTETTATTEEVVTPVAEETVVAPIAEAPIADVTEAEVEEEKPSQTVTPAAPVQQDEPVTVPDLEPQAAPFTK